MILFTSTVGFYSDLRMAKAMKEGKPGLKIAFVGPHRADQAVSGKPHFRVRTSISWCAGEFDHAPVVEFAQGMPVSEILNASYVKDGKVVHNLGRPLLQTEELDARFPSRRMCISETLTIRELQRALLAASVCFLPSTRRADVRRCAPSACGRRRFPATLADAVR